MITPKEIIAKAEYKYLAFLRAALLNEPFFPLRIPGRMASTSTEWNELRKWIETLDSQSDTHKKWSYTIQYNSTVQTRRHGSQTLPESIWFNTEESFLRTIGKKEEFIQFQKDVETIETALPALKGWIQANPYKVIQYTGIWPELLVVCHYFLENNAPNLYAREIPVPVHSKFIEQHRGIVRDLLDYLYSIQGVQPEARDFETRFGLKKPPVMVRFRLLDPDLKFQYNLPAMDIALPAEDFNRLPFAGATVIVSENMLPFLTLPYLPGGIAIFGEGNAVSALNGEWMNSHSIYYWGDLDTQGFRFLANLRKRYPQVESVFMQMATLEKYKEFQVSGVADNMPDPENLTHIEQDAYLFLKEYNLRLEQERITQEDVNDWITGVSNQIE